MSLDKSAMNFSFFSQSLKYVSIGHNWNQGEQIYVS
jgi:hypothetical protein